MSAERHDASSSDAAYRGCTARRAWSAAGTGSASQAQFYGKTLRSIGDAFVHYKAEMVRLIAQMSLGAGALAVIGGTVVDRRLPDAVDRRAGRGAGLQPVRRSRRRGADRVRVGLLQRPADRAGDRRRSGWPPPSAPAPPRSWARCGSTRRSTRWR